MTEREIEKKISFTFFFFFTLLVQDDIYTVIPTLEFYIQKLLASFAIPLPTSQGMAAPTCTHIVFKTN